MSMVFLAHLLWEWWPPIAAGIVLGIVWRHARCVGLFSGVTGVRGFNWSFLISSLVLLIGPVSVQVSVAASCPPHPQPLALPGCRRPTCCRPGPGAPSLPRPTPSLRLLAHISSQAAVAPPEGRTTAVRRAHPVARPRANVRG